MTCKNIFFVLLLSMYCSWQLTAQNQSQEIKNDIVLFSNSLAINSDSALFYIRRANAKSVAIKNDSLLARTSYNLGYYYYLKNNVDSAHIYLKKGLEFSKKSNFKKIISLIYNQQGIIAVDENQFEKALKLYLVAFDIADKYNLFENKSWVLINLGNLAVRQKDTLKALDYYRQNDKQYFGAGQTESNTFNFKKAILTNREKEIIRLIINECTTEEIAEKLGNCISTVESHRRNIYHKLQVKNTAGLVKMAIYLGITN